MGSLSKVQAFFKGENPAGFVPKGEILIERNFYEQQGYGSLIDYLRFLKAEIACLKTNELALWQSFSSTDLFLFAFVPGPLGGFWAKAEEQDFCSTFMKNPGFARNFIEETLQESLIPVSHAMEKGCGGILFADDLAGQNGPLISPEFLRENYFPLVSRLIQAFRQDGFKGPVLFHSDGDIRVFLDDLYEAGFNGLQCLQPCCHMEPQLFNHPKYDDWYFWGNYQFETATQMKDLSGIKGEIPKLLEAWQGKKYIFGSSGGLYKGIPAENVKAAYSLVAQNDR